MATNIIQSLGQSISEVFATPAKRLNPIASELYTGYVNTPEIYNEVREAVRQEMLDGSTGGKALSWSISMNPAILGPDVTKEYIKKNPVDAMTMGLLMKIAEIGADSYVTSRKMGKSKEQSIQEANINVFTGKGIAGRSLFDAISTPGTVGFTASTISAVTKTGEMTTRYPVLTDPINGPYMKMFTGLLDVNAKNEKLDVGSPLGAFLQTAVDRTMIGSFLTKAYDWATGNSPTFFTNYRAAAMMENLQGEKEDRMISPAAKTAATILGYGASIVENIAVAKRLGTPGLLGLNVAKGRLIDYEYSTGLEERFNSKKWLAGMVFDTVTTTIGLTWSQLLGVGASGILGNADGYKSITRMLKDFNITNVFNVGAVPLWNLGLNTAVDMGIDYGFHKLTEGILPYSQSQIAQFGLQAGTKEDLKKLVNSFMMRSAMVIGSGVMRATLASKSAGGNEILSRSWFEKTFAGDIANSPNPNMTRFAIKFAATMWDLYPGNMKGVDQIFKDPKFSQDMETRMRSGQMSFSDYLHAWHLAEKRSNAMYRWFYSGTGMLNANRFYRMMSTEGGGSRSSFGILNILPAVSEITVTNQEHGRAVGQAVADVLGEQIRAANRAAKGKAPDAEISQIASNVFEAANRFKLSPQNDQGRRDEIRTSLRQPVNKILNELSQNGEIEQGAERIIWDSINTLSEALEQSARRSEGTVGSHTRPAESRDSDGINNSERQIMVKIADYDSTPAGIKDPIIKLDDATREHLISRVVEQRKYIDAMTNDMVKTGVATTLLDSGNKVIGYELAKDTRGVPITPIFREYDVLLREEEAGGENLLASIRKLSVEAEKILRSKTPGTYVEYTRSIGNAVGRYMAGELRGLERVLKDTSITNENKLLSVARTYGDIDAIQGGLDRYMNDDTYKQIKSYYEQVIDPLVNSLKRSIKTTKIAGIDADKLRLDFMKLEYIRIYQSFLTPFLMADSTILKKISSDYLDLNEAKVIMMTNATHANPVWSPNLGSFIEIRSDGQAIPIDLSKETLNMSIDTMSRFKWSTAEESMRPTSAEAKGIVATRVKQYLDSVWLNSKGNNQTIFDIDQQRKVLAGYGIDLIDYDEDTHKVTMSYNSNATDTNLFSAWTDLASDVTVAHKTLVKGLVRPSPSNEIIQRMKINGKTVTASNSEMYNNLKSAYPDLDEHLQILYYNHIGDGTTNQFNDVLLNDIYSMLSRKISGFDKLETKEDFIRFITYQALNNNETETEAVYREISKTVDATLTEGVAYIRRVINSPLGMLNAYTIDLREASESDIMAMTEDLTKKGMISIMGAGSTLGKLIVVKPSDTLGEAKGRANKLIEISRLEIEDENSFDAVDAVNPRQKYKHRYWMTLLGKNEIDKAITDEFGTDENVARYLRAANADWKEAMAMTTDTEGVIKSFELKVASALNNVYRAMAMSVQDIAGTEEPKFGTIPYYTMSRPEQGGAIADASAEFQEHFNNIVEANKGQTFDIDSIELYSPMMRAIVDRFTPEDRAILDVDIRNAYLAAVNDSDDSDDFDLRQIAVNTIMPRIAKTIAGYEQGLADRINTAIHLFNSSTPEINVTTDTVASNAGTSQAMAMIHEFRSQIETSPESNYIFGEAAKQEVLGQISGILNDMRDRVTRVNSALKTRGEFFVTGAKTDIFKPEGDNTKIREWLYNLYASYGKSAGVSMAMLPKRFNLAGIERAYTADEVSDIYREFSIANHRPMTFMILRELPLSNNIKQLHDGELAFSAPLARILQNYGDIGKLSFVGFESLAKTKVVSSDDLPADIVLYVPSTKYVSPYLMKLADDLNLLKSPKATSPLIKEFLYGLAKQANTHDIITSGVPSTQTSNFANGSLLIDKRANYNAMRDAEGEPVGSYDLYLNRLASKLRNAGIDETIYSSLMQERDIDGRLHDLSYWNALDEGIVRMYNGAQGFQKFKYRDHDVELFANMQFIESISIVTLAKMVEKRIGDKTVMTTQETDLMKHVHEIYKRSNNYTNITDLNGDIITNYGREFLGFLSTKKYSPFVKYDVTDNNGKKSSVYVALFIRHSIDNEGRMPVVIAKINDVDKPEAIGLNGKALFVQNGDVDGDAANSYNISKASIAKYLADEFGRKPANFLKLSDQEQLEHLFAHQYLVHRAISNDQISIFVGDKGENTVFATPGGQTFYGTIINRIKNIYQGLALAKASELEYEYNINALVEQEDARVTDSEIRAGLADHLKDIDPSMIIKPASRMQTYKFVRNKFSVIAYDAKGSNLVDKWDILGGLKLSNNSGINKIGKGYYGFYFDLSGVRLFAIAKAEDNSFAMKSLGIFYSTSDFNSEIREIAAAANDEVVDGILKRMKSDYAELDINADLRFARPGLLAQQGSSGLTDMVKAFNGLDIMRANISGDTDQQKQAAFVKMMRGSELASATALYVDTSNNLIAIPLDMADDLDASIRASRQGDAALLRMMAVPIKRVTQTAESLMARLSGTERQERIRVSVNHKTGSLISKLNDEVKPFEDDVYLFEKIRNGRTSDDETNNLNEEGMAVRIKDFKARMITLKSKGKIDKDDLNGNLDYLNSEMYTFVKHLIDPGVLYEDGLSTYLPKSVRSHIMTGQVKLLNTTGSPLPIMSDYKKAKVVYDASVLADYLIQNYGTFFTRGSILELARSINTEKVFVDRVSTTDDLINRLFDTMKEAPSSSGKLLSKTWITNALQSMGIAVNKTAPMAFVNVNTISDGEFPVLNTYINGENFLQKAYAEKATAGRYGVLEIKGKQLTSPELYSTMVRAMKGMNNFERARVKVLYTAMSAIVDPVSQSHMVLLGNGANSRNLNTLANLIEGHDGLDYKIDIEKIDPDYAFFNVNEDSKLLATDMLDDLGIRARTPAEIFRGVCK